MTLKLHKPRYRPHTVEVDGWENTVETLAMTLCPVQEWQRYERQMQHVAWLANKRANSAKVKVFPVWRKYRQQATKIAQLYRVAPMLRHLPLQVTGFLGELLLK